jgi:hypothetical protein
VNKYPWEYDEAIQHLQESLNNYARLLEQLDLNTTQEMDSIEGKTLFYIVDILLRSMNVVSKLEYEQDAPVTSYTTTTIDDDEDYGSIEKDEEQLMLPTPSTTYMEQHYQSLFNCIFQDRPITRRRNDYDAEDPTLRILQKIILLCRELVEAIEIRFKDTPSIFLLMKNCLDVSSLYE